MKQKKQGFRKGSQQEYLANKLREHNLNIEVTRAAIADDIGKIPQLIFKQNPGGGAPRVPYPLGSITDDSQAQTQHGRAIKALFSVKRILQAGGEGDRQREQKQEEHKQEREAGRTSGRTTARPSNCSRSSAPARKYCDDKAADGNPLDEIGLRPVEYGAAMLANESRSGHQARDDDALPAGGTASAGRHGVRRA